MEQPPVLADTQLAGTSTVDLHHMPNSDLIRHRLELH